MFLYFGLLFVHGSEAAWLRPAVKPGISRDPDTVDIGNLDMTVNLGIAHTQSNHESPMNSEQQSSSKRACETKREEQSRYTQTKTFWEQWERRAKQDKKEKRATGKEGKRTGAKEEDQGGNKGQEASIA